MQTDFIGQIICGIIGNMIVFYALSRLPDHKVPHSVTRKWTFIVFWAYNMVVGFVPAIFPGFLTQYHWWMFAVGLVAILALYLPGERR